MSAMRARRCDLLVLGAGPAGMAAATQAAACGLSVTLLDEQGEAGGQVYRAAPAEFSPARPSPDATRGAALRQALATSGARHLPMRRAWFV